MKIKRKIFALALICVVCLGCAQTLVKVNMYPSALMSQVKQEIPVTVGIYLSPDTAGYILRREEASELCTLEYNFGAASRNMFFEGFKRAALGVKSVTRKPPYGSGENSDVTVVLEPQIIDFDESAPAVSRGGSYSAHITYRVVVYGLAGNVLLDKIYQAKGEAKGYRTSNIGGNYAAPVEVAMNDIIKQIAGDVAGVVERPK